MGWRADRFAAEVFVRPLLRLDRAAHALIAGPSWARLACRLHHRHDRRYSVDRVLPISADRLADFCRRHRIQRLSLFGSTVRCTARPDSDTDLLVEFEPGHEPGLFALAGMELELSELLGGRTVDLRTPRDLSRHFRADVLATAQVQYAR
jgi:uncharacterized protein